MSPHYSVPLSRHRKCDSSVGLRDMTEELTLEDKQAWAIRSPLRFGIAMVSIIFGLKILAIPLVLVLGGGDTSGPVLKGGAPLVLLAFAILPIETFLGQAFPLWLLMKLGVRQRFALCALSGTFFGVLHLSAGFGGWVIGFTAGIVLSYCWLSWRVKSLGTAFWLTTAVHAAHNAVAFPLYMVLENF